MKTKNEKDFWRYQYANGIAMESYRIDGTFRGKHTSAQYLIDQYNMNDEEAYKYLNNVRHL